MYKFEYIIFTKLFLSSFSFTNLINTIYSNMSHSKNKDPLLKKMEQDHSSLKNKIVSLLREAWLTSLELFKITIPVGLLTRILREFGITDILASWLEPVMACLGLPGDAALVWGTTILTNLYGGIVVYASLAQDLALSTAQVTVLTTMMLVAHALPLELAIARKAGARLRASISLRISCAFLFGWILHHIYRLTETLSAPAEALWNPPQTVNSWMGWFTAEMQNSLSIFIIILTLLFSLKVLKACGIIDLLQKLLTPILRILGMSKSAAPITLIGMTLGLSYGGGLIIQEARKGDMPATDIFYSLALMGLAHGLVEDTLLMMLIGGQLSGILWGRLILSLIAIFLLVRVVRYLPERIFYRFLFRPSPKKAH